MDNTSLCRLIREALHSPQKAEALALAIDHLPEVKKYLDKAWLPYYDQAIPVTTRDIKRNINKFPQIYSLNLETINCHNPHETANLRQRFISWVVMILKRDCYDAWRNKTPLISLDDDTIDGITSILDIIPDAHLTGIDKLLKQEFDLEVEQIGLYIQEDPNRVLRECHPRDRPDCNCQILLQRRFLDDPPSRFDKISHELQIPFGTMSAHWQRKCLPLMRKVAKDLVYETVNSLRE